MHDRSLFITVEGIDGAGKSTLIQKLSQACQEIGKPVITTQEPGGSKLGTMLRTLLQNQPHALDGKSEYLLFAADRAEHFSQVVLPALQQQKIVISDRGPDSSIAYQGYGHHVDTNMITLINHWTMQQRLPDITFYLRINSSTALQRLLSRDQLTTFEQEKSDFWQRVIQGYETLYATPLAGRYICTIDAHASIEEIFTQAWNEMSAFFEKKNTRHELS